MEAPEGDAHAVLMQMLKQQVARHRIPEDPPPYEYCLRYLSKGKTVKLAAVLVLFFVRGGELHVLLTKRSTSLRGYAGDVAFPGGMREDGDGDHVDTCLRETEEEIGVPRDMVTILGTLYPIVMRSGTCVVPVVGVIPNHLPYYPNDEVDLVFSLPLRRFLRSEGHTHTCYKPPGYQTGFEVDLFNDLIKEHNQSVTTFGFTAFVCIRLAVAVFRQLPEYECNWLTVEHPYGDYRERYERNIAKDNVSEKQLKHKL